MLQTKTAEQIFYSAYEISVKAEICATLENMDDADRIFESLYAEAEEENLLNNLFKYFEMEMATEEIANRLSNYCSKWHPEIMERDDETENIHKLQIDI